MRIVFDPQDVVGVSKFSIHLKQFHEAHDMTQRRAQIVGDRIIERLEFLAGSLQVRSAFEDTPLQFRVEDADFVPRLFALRVNIQNQDAVLRRFEQPPVKRSSEAPVACSIRVVILFYAAFIMSHGPVRTLKR